MGIRSAKGATFPTNVPVVVIGAGACGLCAALAVKEGGTDAIVLERDDRPSGSTALSNTRGESFKAGVSAPCRAHI